MKHVAGVLRAVEKLRTDMLIHIGGLISPDHSDYEKAKQAIADIIAEETAQPELLEAAKGAKGLISTLIVLMQMASPRLDADLGEIRDEVRLCVTNMEAAIKRSEGE